MRSAEEPNRWDLKRSERVWRKKRFKNGDENGEINEIQIFLRSGCVDRCPRDDLKIGKHMLSLLEGGIERIQRR